MHNDADLVAEPERPHPAVELLLWTWPLVYVALGFFVVYSGAWAEPYVCFRPLDALVQVGFACWLLASLAVWLVALAGELWRRRISRHTLWALVPIVFITAYLAASPYGYVEDLERYAGQFPCPGPR